MSGSYDDCPITLVFHKLSRNCTFGVTNYTPTRLSHLLGNLRHNGWRFSELTDGLVAPRQGRGRLVLSFDDGYQHLVDVLPPLMEQFDFQPLVFVPTELIGKQNTWDYSFRLRPFAHLSAESITRLADMGVIFGSHGASHRDLTRCSDTELAREMGDSRKRLQEITGQEIALISYPFGRYDQHVLEAAASAGYRRCFSMSFPALSDNPLTTGRIPIYSFDTPLSVRLKLSNSVLRQIERAKARIVNALSGGTVWLNQLRH